VQVYFGAPKNPALQVNDVVEVVRATEFPSIVELVVVGTVQVIAVQFVVKFAEAPFVVQV
jgi:hypothetical protein